jgi:hypothetical protein
MQAGSTLRYETYKISNSVWNKVEMPEKWKESIIVPFMRRVIK